MLLSSNHVKERALKITYQISLDGHHFKHNYSQQPANLAGKGDGTKFHMQAFSHLQKCEATKALLSIKACTNYSGLYVFIIYTGHFPFETGIKKNTKNNIQSTQSGTCLLFLQRTHLVLITKITLLIETTLFWILKKSHCRQLSREYKPQCEH